MDLMLLDTGMRFGEVASLAWNYVDFANKSISIVDTKSKKNRTAYISKPVDKVLTSRLPCSNKKSGLIFPGTNGTPIKKGRQDIPLPELYKLHTKKEHAICKACLTPDVLDRLAPINLLQIENGRFSGRYFQVRL